MKKKGKLIIVDDGERERLCEHGVGHPIRKYTKKERWRGVHTCDGYKCCVAAQIQHLRETTPCSKCGGGPIEWHNDDHRKHRNSRVGAMVAQQRRLDRIYEEIEKCMPLCRSCHMKIDGRLAALAKNAPIKRGDSFPPKECRVCTRLYKPMRKSMCYTCYELHRVGGRSYGGHPYSERRCDRNRSTGRCRK